MQYWDFFVVADIYCFIIKDIFLDESECYTFELNDYYGDGLGGSLWGGSDGSWTLKDFNNVKSFLMGINRFDEKL